jgi:hypothetical protein
MKSEIQNSFGLIVSVSPPKLHSHHVQEEVEEGLPGSDSRNPRMESPAGI